jgi:outer membrane lipoprotein SlyB
MKKIRLLLVMLVPLVLAGCTDADMVSQNLSRDADYFKVNRRVVFYNGITSDYMLSIE